MNEVSYSEISNRAKARLSELRELAAAVPYESKGILYSEILFLVACLRDVRFDRIVESGRARGQSTLLLSKAFPKKKVLSVEYSEKSPDVPIAAARLADCKNVNLLFGDARKVLPRIVQDDDIVVIDGPKGYRALRLALRLLTEGKVSNVFLHDLTRDTPERDFVSRYLPEARFSDERTYAEIGSVLDATVVDTIPPHARLKGFAGDFGYGYAMTWLPRKPNRNYRWLLLLAALREKLAL